MIRWWRAPEVYIDEKHYREKLDIWSVGCIMGELILLRPLFRGRDHMDQLDKILQILGTPSAATLNEICIPGLYTNNYEKQYDEIILATITCINQLPLRERQDFNQLFGFKYDGISQTPISGVSPSGK